MVSDKNVRIAKVLLLLSASLIVVVAAGALRVSAVGCVPVTTSRGVFTTAAIRPVYWDN